jgi:hypothetical protein
MANSPYVILGRSHRAIRTVFGDTITVYAGGRHVYIPARIRARAGITNRVMIYYERQAKVLRFVGATERNFRHSYGCRTGMCGATVFPRIFGYVPDTTWVPVTIEDGKAVVMRLYDLYRDAPIIDLRPEEAEPVDEATAEQEVAS